MEWKKGSYRVNDEKSELDLYYITPALQESYWAIGRTEETVKESIGHSLCFGLYSEDRQIGFALVALGLILPPLFPVDPLSVVPVVKVPLGERGRSLLHRMTCWWACGWRDPSHSIPAIR